MRILGSVVLAALVLVAAPLPADAAKRKPGLGRLIAQKLFARKKATIAPRTHTTDFAGEQIGCITLTRGEMRSFGYPGHAFVCEEAATAEVLGAALNRVGVPICYISGFYVGDGCYDLDICEVPETFCVE